MCLSFYYYKGRLYRPQLTPLNLYSYDLHLTGDELRMNFYEVQLFKGEECQH